MSIETLIPLLVEHNSLVIQILVALILFLVMVLAYLGFSYAKKAEEGHHIGPASADMGQIEESLKKLLERANHVPAPAAVIASGADENSAVLAAEIESLKKSLEERQQQIETLKTASAQQSSAAAPAASGLSDDESALLKSQIQDLQAKLSEYEIISEDIADLSRFKEENTKLKSELEALRSGGVITPETSAGAPEEAAAAPAPVPPAPVEALVEAAIPEPAPIPAATPAAAPASPERSESQNVFSADDDLIREFAEAVNAQNAALVGTNTTEEKIIEKMAAVNAPAPAIDESAAAGLFDVERMTAEAGALQASEGPEVTAEQAIGSNLDPDKIAAEAAKMEGLKAEDAKLMGEFEEFMKKGGN